jgi:hypothetical protein
LNCAYNMKLWTCVAKLFSTIAYMVVCIVLQRHLRSVCERTQNSDPHLLVCVLQVNDARLEPTMVSRIDIMLVDCHWAQMVSYCATRSCRCRLPDHVPELLLLATTSTCYSCNGPCPWAATPGHHYNLLMLARALAVLLLGWPCPPVPHDWP